MTSLIAAVAPRTGKIIKNGFNLWVEIWKFWMASQTSYKVRIYTDEKL